MTALCLYNKTCAINIKKLSFSIRIFVKWEKTCTKSEMCKIYYIYFRIIQISSKQIKNMPTSGQLRGLPQVSPQPRKGPHCIAPTIEKV